MTINAATGAEIELPDPLGLWELKPRPATGRADALHLPTGGGPGDPAGAERQPTSSSAAWTARIQRDRRRLREYYGALLREADHKKPRGGVKPDPEKIAARKRAVDLELRRKLAELDERYADDARRWNRWC